MKRHPLAVMMALALLQTACSSRQETPVAEPATTPANTTTAADQSMELAKRDVAVKPAVVAPSAPPVEAQAEAGMVMEDMASARASARASGGAMARQKAEAKMMSAPMPAMQAYAIAPPPVAMAAEERDSFAHFNDNPVKQVGSDPVSTFSLDVDTGSYALTRQFLQQGRLPASDAVRTEELINYFRYDYPRTTGEHPFAVQTELSTAPWQPDHYLLRIGVQAQDAQATALPPANLVFLVDVSGSMDEPNKLPLVISSLQMLTKQLRPQDRVSLVVYAGRTEVVLEPTAGNRTAEIQAALGRLQAGGSTAGASALALAYKMARKGFIRNGINRILLATDGDFNVGVTDTDQIKDMVKRERESGVTLSTLGFGQGNFNDAMMEQIADVGNGNYSYVDSLTEARKVLVDELASTFNTVAKDVKVQIEFNPALVREYRLIGYENRQLNREDFNNDKVDAGDVGAGKSVTAIYELTPASAAPSVDPLRYQAGKPAAAQTFATRSDGQELAFLKLRYKIPSADTSILMSRPVVLPAGVTPFERASTDHRFATAVAGFGQLLRQSPQVGSLSFAQVAQMAAQAKGSDATGSRAEFVQLVRNAGSLAVTRGEAVADDQPLR